MASTYLTRTPSSSGTQTKATISVWFKRSNLSANQCIFSTGNNNFVIKFGTSDKLGIYDYNGSSMDLELNPSMVFRDTSAWYHIVVSLDSTQATASNRAKLYVNGSLISDFDSTTYPSQNYNFKVNGTLEHFIGRLSGLSQYFDGSISHLHMVDGTAYDASAFGSTDATTGEWKINTSPSVTYGTNGFFILKDGNSVTDQSGNSNNFTVGGGTLTKTEDCPSNVFATWNSLDNFYQSNTYSKGNLQVQTQSTSFTYNSATIGVSTGKWYWEVEYDAKSGGTDQPMIGITSTQPTANDNELGNFPNDFAWYTDNGTGYLSNNNTYSNVGFNAYTVGDVISVALDLDNNKLYFAKNGTWEKSGNPESGSTGTGAISITSTASTPLGAYFPSVGDGTTSYNSTFKANFGNGYFGTTAVSSAGTNASGIGIFEYDVPTGYTALSTKGLNL